MNPQLAAFFAAHKPAILAGGAAAVAGLAYVQRKRSAGAGVPTTAGASVPSIAGTIPAAAVVPTGSGGGGGTYDSSSYDTYNALQPELGTIAQLLQAQAAAATSAGSGTAAAPAPVSSPILNTPAPAPVTAPKLSIAQSLFRANGTGNYVKYGDGTIGEVESDGSIYGLAKAEVMANGQMWDPSMGATALPWQHWNDNPSAEPTYGDKVHNLAGAAKA